MGLQRDVIDDRIVHLAHDFQFTEYVDQRQSTLSKGTRQKVSLAQALIHEPDIVILDEPTANLDIEATDATEILILEYIQHEQLYAIVSTHGLDQAARISDDLIVIDSGRVVLTESLVDLNGGRGRRDEVDVRAMVLGAISKSREHQLS